MEYQIEDIKLSLNQAHARMKKAVKLIEIIENAQKILQRNDTAKEEIEANLETFTKSLQEFEEAISSSTTWSSVAHSHVQTIIGHMMSLAEAETNNRPTLGNNSSNYMSETHTHG